MNRSAMLSPVRIALLIGWMLICACSRQPALAPLPPEGVVLAFGDSITHGTGAAPGESYPLVLEKLIGRRVVNAGLPGEVTAGGRARLEAVLDEEKPALLLLCLGGNDFLRHLDEATTKENLRGMVELARQRGVGVVLIAVPKPGFGLDVPSFYAEIAADARIPLEGKTLERVLEKKSLKSDLIHPNAAGYRILAESLARLLRDCGAIQGG